MKERDAHFPRWLFLQGFPWLVQSHPSDIRLSLTFQSKWLSLSFSYLSSYTVYISHDTCHNVKFLLTWLLLGSCHWSGSSVKAIILLIVFIAVILRVVPSTLLLNDELIGWLNEWKTERTDLFLRRSNVDALAHRKICIQIWAPSHTS